MSNRDNFFVFKHRRIRGMGFSGAQCITIAETISWAYYGCHRSIIEDNSLEYPSAAVLLSAHHIIPLIGCSHFDLDLDTLLFTRLKMPRVFVGGEKVRSA